VNFLFECLSWEGTPVINEPDLFDELVWAEPRELPAPVAEWVPGALQALDAGRWYREMEWD
jgi:hypothetical protein